MSNKLIIEFLNPHSLNMGEDFYYVSTFKKGKAGTKIVDYRILVKGIDTGKEMLMALQGRENFFGRPVSYMIDMIDVCDPGHIKGENKKYNYYKLSEDPSTVSEFLDLWKLSDPMVSVGGYTHQFISSITNYQGSYKFNGIVY